MSLHPGRSSLSLSPAGMGHRVRLWAPAEVLRRDGGESCVGPRASILLDVHGHYYDRFDAGTFLNHARRNFAHAAAASGLERCAPGHLVVAATRRGEGLAELHAKARAGTAGLWRLTPCADGVSMLATRGDAPELVLIAGRQVVTAERLEVLAVACAAPIPDGMSLRETVEAARSAGAVVVLPWGFGKWWFGRGRTVAAYLDAEPGTGIYLADSAQRPRVGPAPALLRRADIRILAGTDPLPLASDVGAAGRYGCIIEAEFNPRRPAESLRRALADPKQIARSFGERGSLAAFLRAQLAIRAPGGSRTGGGR